MKIKCFIDENGCIWTYSNATKSWNHPLTVVENEVLREVIVISNEDGQEKLVLGTYTLFDSLGAISLVVERPATDCKQSAPLTGEWHHGNNTLVCGTIRVANLDVDTNPGESFNGEVLSWMCKALNKSVCDERAAGLHKLNVLG